MASSLQTPNYTLIPFILQTIFILIAPALLTASIYMVLGRIIAVTDGEKYSLIRKMWLTKIFVCLDTVSFLVQMGGAGLMTGDRLLLGRDIVLAGLSAEAQIVGFIAFTLTAIKLHIGLNKRPASEWTSSNIPWKKHLYVLYAACVLILVRSIMRVIEFSEGLSGVIFTHEWFLYVFDATLIVITVVIFHFVHPGEIKAILSGGTQTTRDEAYTVCVASGRGLEK